MYQKYMFLSKPSVAYKTRTHFPKLTRKYAENGIYMVHGFVCEFFRPDLACKFVVEHSIVICTMCKMKNGGSTAKGIHVHESLLIIK